jgi:circadian clock protein KaiC
MVKMLRFAQTFSFFRPQQFNKNVIYADLGSALANKGVHALWSELQKLVEEHRPELVVLDSFKVLREFENTDTSHRRLMTDLSTWLAAWDTTTLLVGEYTEEDIRSQPEFAVADGIIYLHGTEEGHQQKRWLRIMKMRGTDFFSGDHLFTIGQDGITLYPRMRPRVTGGYSAPDGERMSSTIEGLNVLIDGGLPTSTSTLIMGESGAGKTMTALSFAVGEGRREDAPRKTLYVTLEESADQLARNCEAFGWDLPELVASGSLEIMQVSPSELDIDRHAVVIRERADEIGAKTVILDSITSMETATEQFGKLQSYLWAINDHFKRCGIAVIMTAELATEGTARISPYVDTLIALRLVEQANETKRAIRIVKMRGSAHDKLTRELVIEAPRVLVGDRLSGP